MQSPSKEQEHVHSWWLLFTCFLTFVSLQKLVLPLCTVAYLSCAQDSKEAALKGNEDGNYRLGSHWFCTHASSQPLYPLQNMKAVRERCVMHRVWFFPAFFFFRFILHLSEASRRKSALQKLLHVINKINMLRAHNTFLKYYLYLSITKRKFFICVLFS